jgi:predicted phosphoribosyltransferase
MFRDRTEAGQRLARAVVDLAPASPVVYALPRGGVPVARAVADALGAPLDLLLVRKIGAPGQRELALGAVVDGDPPIVVRNDDVMRGFGLTEQDVDRLAAAETAENRRRRRLFVGDRPPLSPTGHTAIVVDDGLATGATAKAAVAGLRRLGAGRIILAVPVAPADTLDAFTPLVDDVVCLEPATRFFGVGAFYDDFRQLGDEDVTAQLGSRGAVSD